jgi:hypothetical protein
VVSLVQTMPIPRLFQARRLSQLRMDSLHANGLGENSATSIVRLKVCLKIDSLAIHKQVSHRPFAHKLDDFATHLHDCIDKNFNEMLRDVLTFLVACRRTQVACRLPSFAAANAVVNTLHGGPYQPKHEGNRHACCDFRVDCQAQFV